MYKVLEISLGDNRRLVQYNVDQLFGAKFYLKGFEYPWILSSRQWKAGDKVLDLGAAYSPLPIHIADTYGCEVWAVDDFGSSSDEDWWQRNQDPQKHIDAYPQVRYVLERLGDPDSSTIPENYFDCIYSASTLEHVDLSLRTKRGSLSLAKALLLEGLLPLMPAGMQTRYTFYTPKTYARSALAALGQSLRPVRKLPNAFTSAINPEIMLESPKALYHRVVKDNLQPKKIGRTIALLLALEKSTAD
jgi:hypothetical protein